MPDLDEPAVQPGMPSTVAHLAALLAYEVDAVGQVVLHSRASNRWIGLPYTLAEADAIARIAARRSEDVYLRTTLVDPAFRGPGRGGAGITRAVTALFGDFDIAGPGHAEPPGLHRLPSRAEVLELLAELPAPSFLIFTGGGFHAWWLLAAPLVCSTVKDRQAAARFVRSWGDTLVQRGARHGLHVDQVGDLARLGRLSGTLNHKRTPADRVHLVDVADWPADGLLDGALPRRYDVAQLVDITRSTLPTITAEPARRAPKQLPMGDEDRSPASACRHLSWAQILEPHGWTLVGHENLDGRPWELWRRPGDPMSRYSLKADPDGPCIVWSSSAALPAGPGQHLSKFRVVAWLEFGGDEARCARWIRAEARKATP